MTDENIEKLVLLVASGKNTVADLAELFPKITNTELHEVVENDDFSNPMESTPNPNAPLQFIERPLNYSDRYRFMLTDSFRLSEYGEDILYRLRKEESAKTEAVRQHEESMKINREIKKLTIINIIVSATVGLLAIFVAIAIAYMTK